MATIVGDKVKLSSGQLVTPQTGGWYDSQQYWGGTLSQPGQINTLSNQQGAGQQVSSEVLRQTSVAAGLAPTANEEYINRLRQQAQTKAGEPTTAPTFVGGTTGTVDTTTQASTTLTDLQKKRTDLETSIANKKAEADKRKAEVNDNPFLSEASRVGRIAKIDAQLNDSLQADQAALTSLATQISTEQTRIDKAAEAAKPDYQITTETDNAGNVTVLTIDKKTGNIVSKVSAGKVGKAATTGTGGVTNTTLIGTYVPKAAAILEAIDLAGNPVFNPATAKNEGDKLLSQAEFEDAYNKIKVLAGGNETLANQIMNSAWDLGGYQRWNW